MVNKETALGLLIEQNLGRWDDRTECWEEERQSGERCNVSMTGDGCAKTLLVSHNHMVIHRLVEMG